MVVEIFEALIQLRIEVDEIIVRCIERRSLGVGRLELVVGVGAVDCREGKTDALEQQPGALHRRHRIVERRGRGLIGDRGNFALLLRHAGEDRGKIIAVLDPREIGGVSSGSVLGLANGFDAGSVADGGRFGLGGGGKRRLSSGCDGQRGGREQ